MLTTMNCVNYKPLSSNEVLNAEMIDGLCTVRSEKGQVLECKGVFSNGELKLTIEKDDLAQNDDLLLVAVEYLLGHNSEITSVEILGFNKLKSTDHLLQKYFSTQNGVMAFKREQFFQLRGSWHIERDFNPTVETWTKSNERIHPVRPDIKSGTIYSRYIPLLGKTLSFRIIDRERDLDIFHNWHNQFRVANFWELQLPKDELLQYIDKVQNDPHTMPMIAECNGEPVGYFEMYWCREDRLAPYYESEPFDRGFHFLIGNPSFLGFNNTDSILRSLAHFLFLDDVRTRRIMAEPRSDNKKVLKYTTPVSAWKVLYEFDFPHKRAALLENCREDFFTGSFL